MFQLKKDTPNTITNSLETVDVPISQLKNNVEKAEEALLKKLLSEAHRLFEKNNPADEESKQFFETLKGLSHKVLGPVGYELSKLGLSRGNSGFHGIGGATIPLPFEFLTYSGGYEYGGIAFKINTECFQAAEARLFFEANEYPYYSGTPDNKLESIIWNASSQIDNISVMIEENKGYRYSRIEFSVRKNSKPWGSIRLAGGSIPSSIVNAPVIQLPYIGEFNCCFGEVTPHGDVVLHRDDFCMK